MTDLLRRGLKLAHLRLLVELAETGQLGLAAARLGVTQPAASRLLAEAEAICGLTLRRRDGRGIALTAEGQALAQRGRRILTELGEAGREMAEISAGAGGHVRLGAVTGAALEHVMPALRSARVSYPAITVEVEVGTTDLLGDLLREGRLDLALCRMPADAGPEEFDMQLIGPEPVSLVARRGHALDRGVAATAEELLHYDWILPGPGAILRRTVLEGLAARGLPPPPGRLATSSFLLTLAWVTQSNALAPMAAAVARHFAEVGDFAIIPEELNLNVAPYGLLTRRDGMLTPAAARIRALLATGFLAAPPQGG